MVDDGTQELVYQVKEHLAVLRHDLNNVRTVLDLLVHQVKEQNGRVRSVELKQAEQSATIASIPASRAEQELRIRSLESKVWRAAGAVAATITAATLFLSATGGNL